MRASPCHLKPPHAVADCLCVTSLRPPRTLPRSDQYDCQSAASKNWQRDAPQSEFVAGRLGGFLRRRHAARVIGRTSGAASIVSSLAQAACASHVQPTKNRLAGPHRGKQMRGETPGLLGTRPTSAQQRALGSDPSSESFLILRSKHAGEKPSLVGLAIA